MAHITERQGFVYFSGFDPTGGVTVSVNLPETYRGIPLQMWVNSRSTIYLEPRRFSMYHKSVTFRAEARH